VSDYKFPLPLVEHTTVRVMEVGRPSVIQTPARRSAPQAAIVAGQLLETRRFGELALVVLDWSNGLGLQPPEVAKPTMFMSVSRWFPEQGKHGLWLRVESRIDIDSVFGQDAMTRSILEDLIAELGHKMADAALM
jgi:hypothetical protein